MRSTQSTNIPDRHAASDAGPLRYNIISYLDRTSSRRGCSSQVQLTYGRLRHANDLDAACRTLHDAPLLRTATGFSGIHCDPASHALTKAAKGTTLACLGFAGLPVSTAATARMASCVNTSRKTLADIASNDLQEQVQATSQGTRLQRSECVPRASTSLTHGVSCCCAVLRSDQPPASEIGCTAASGPGHGATSSCGDTARTWTLRCRRSSTMSSHLASTSSTRRTAMVGNPAAGCIHRHTL